MGNKKYFFFDYDGTLAVPRTRSIPQSTLEALDELRAQGHFIALATGRLQVNAVDYIDSAGYYQYCCRRRLFGYVERRAEVDGGTSACSSEEMPAYP